jgi:hypothetical protein
MSEYRLAEGLYLHPTPAGAYYSASSKEQDDVRQFLGTLLVQTESPSLDIKQLKHLMAMDNADDCHYLLHECQQLGFIQGVDKPLKSPVGTLEQILPSLLSKICQNDKALLADSEGFCLASHGFSQEVADELSVIGAEIATIHERRSGLLLKDLNLDSHAWALVNAPGNSQAGFWPLFIGDTRFLIAILGIPHFNQPEFVELVWALSTRYATNQ